MIYSGNDIRQFLGDFAMTKEQFVSHVQVLHPQMSHQNLDNWLGQHHAISGRMGAVVERFMNDYAKSHSRQTNLFDLVS